MKAHREIGGFFVSVLTLVYDINFQGMVKLRGLTFYSQCKLFSESVGVGQG